MKLIDILKNPQLYKEYILNPVNFAKIMKYKLTPYQKFILESMDKKTIVLMLPRQSGKSFTLSWMALLESLKPKREIIFVSKSLRQTLHIRDMIQNILDSNPKVSKMLFPYTARQKITSWVKSNIYFFPNNPDALRGFTAHLIIVDEFAFFNDAEYMLTSVLMPMLNTTGGNLIVSSTPTSRKTMFYNMVQREDVFVIHTTWRDSLEHGVMKPEIFEQYKEMYRKGLISEQQWYNEFEALFYDDVDVFINPVEVEKCIDDKIPQFDGDDVKNGMFTIGIDLGKHETNTVITVVEHNNGIKYIRKILILPLETEYDKILDIVDKLIKQYREINYIYVDRTGSIYLADKFVQRFGNMCVPYHFTSQNRIELTTYLKSMIKENKLRIPKDFYIPTNATNRLAFKQRNLLTVLSSPRRKYKPNTNQVTIEFDEEGTDVFWSVCLGLYATHHFDE